MRHYETIFIASPTLTDEQADELVKQYEGIIAEQGGELLKTDKWGRKKLAYEVQKFSEGYYTLFEMNAGPNLIAELERRFRNNDAVIKYMSVRLDEAEKSAGRTKQRIEREATIEARAFVLLRALATGADPAKANHLSMVSLESLLRGGANGAAVVPGEGAASLLVRKLKGMDIDGQRMPLGKPPLPDEVVGVIEKWIDQGTKLDLLAANTPLETVAAAGRARRRRRLRPAQVRVRGEGRRGRAAVWDRTCRLAMDRRS